MDTSTTKDMWDKVAAVGSLLSGLLIPIVVIVVGGKLNESLKVSDNQMKYVEIATSLIREEPKEENFALRSWAIDVLAHFSKNVPLTEAAREEMKKRKAPIYSGGWGNTTFTEVYSGSPVLQQKPTSPPAAPK